MSEKSRTYSLWFEILVGFLAILLLLVGLFLYVLNEPERLVSAQEAQLGRELDEAMTIYAENCSVCHGVDGAGIGATPPLDNPALRESESDALGKIISRGLYNTAMPAWSQEDGGVLSDFQIEEAVKLIQFGDWNAVQDRVVNLGMAPLVPFASEPDPEVLAALEGSPEGDALARGITVFANECVACHGSDGMGTSLAPALNDPIVRSKTEDEIQRTILNGVPNTLMAPWGNALTDEELADVVGLIMNWDAVPIGAVPAAEVNIPVTEESLMLGEEMFATYCSGCHGPEGQGTQRAPSLNVKGFLENTSDGAIEQIITLGVPGTAMPAWGDRMTDAQIQAITGFIRSWEPTAPEVAEPTRVRGPWWQTTGSTPPKGQEQDQGQGHQGGGPPAWAGKGSGRNGRRGTANGTVGENPLSPDYQATEPAWGFETPLLENGEGNNSLPGEQVPSLTGQPLTELPPGQQPNQLPDSQTDIMGDEGNHVEGEIPPWIEVKATNEEQSSFDLRGWVLFGGIVSAALILIFGGLIGLWWIAKKRDNMR